MRLPKLLRVTGILVVAVMLLGLAGPAGANQTGSGATLAPAVSEWLSSSAPDDQLEVVITFWSEKGIDRLEAMIGSPERLKTVPMALATLTATDIREVASWRQTRSVWNNEELELYLDDGTRMVKADRVWAGERLNRPYLGTGVGVAVVDTGTDATHPDLPYGTKVKRNFYVGGNPLGPAPADTFFLESTLTDTEHGHGTHVASIIAGTGAASGGQYTGVAPGADIYAFKVGLGASVLLWWAARSFDWVIENGETNNIRVISNSWGGSGGADYNPNDPIDVLAKLAYDNDIVVVFSAGNSGGPNKLNRYAVSPYVVSVAAANKDFTRASFSSTGRPGGDMVRDDNGIYRPTITAPGVDIVAARSSMGFVMSQGTQVDNPFYTSASGTSMSAPHVSGIIALMLEARPSLSAQNVIDILEGTAVNMRDFELWEVGAGFADAQAAVRAAEQARVAFPPLTKGKTPMYQLLQSDKWEGIVGPGGYALLPVSNVLADEIEIEIGSQVDAIYAEIAWTTEAENIYLFLYDPDGKEVEASAGLTDLDLDFDGIRVRTVATTNPVPGTWTIQVVGRVNTVTQYRGFYGLYRQSKPKPAKGTTTSTHEISGELLHSVDPVNHSTFHEFQVPDGTTAVSARIEWTDPDQDIDLYIYDAAGNRVGASTNFNPDTGDASEEAHVAGSDPMAPGTFLPGTWTVEVRGWLVLDPQQYDGFISVTSGR